jgi:hypothetical protein
VVGPEDTLTVLPASYETEEAATEPVVTVGLDGSPECLAAARWAADETERRRLTLRLPHAWPLLVPEPTGIPAEVDQKYWAKRIVHHARAELQTRHPGLLIVVVPAVRRVVTSDRMEGGWRGMVRVLRQRFDRREAAFRWVNHWKGGSHEGRSADRRR